MTPKPFLPVESYGHCNACGREGYLGDGLCRDCWDGPDHWIWEQDRIERNREIVRLSSAGFTPYELARAYKLHPMTIRKIQMRTI